MEPYDQVFILEDLDKDSLKAHLALYNRKKWSLKLFLAYNNCMSPHEYNAPQIEYGGYKDTEYRNGEYRIEWYWPSYCDSI